MQFDAMYFPILVPVWLTAFDALVEVSVIPEVGVRQSCTPDHAHAERQRHGQAYTMLNPRLHKIDR